MMKMRFQNVTKAFEHLKTFVFFLLTLQWEHKKPSLTKDRKGGVSPADCCVLPFELFSTSRVYSLSFILCF